MTREPYFYEKIHPTKYRGDDTKKYQIFGVPIGNSKIRRKVQFHPAVPVIKYHQNTSNSFGLSGFESAFHCISDNRSVPALVNSIEESFTLQKENCKNIIHLTSSIITNRRRIKGGEKLRYNLTIWNKK